MSPVKGSKVLAEFSIAPLGQKGTSISRYVATAILAVKGVEGLRCKVTPIGTILEADNLETILEAVKIAHEALIAKGILRVESTLRIDDRRDKPRAMTDKVNAVKKYMKKL